MRSSQFGNSTSVTQSRFNRDQGATPELALLVLLRSLTSREMVPHHSPIPSGLQPSLSKPFNKATLQNKEQNQYR